MCEDPSLVEKLALIGSATRSSARLSMTENEACSFFMRKTPILHNKSVTKTGLFSQYSFFSGNQSSSWCMRRFDIITCRVWACRRRSTSRWWRQGSCRWTRTGPRGTLGRARRRRCKRNTGNSKSLYFLCVKKQFNGERIWVRCVRTSG